MSGVNLNSVNFEIVVIGSGPAGLSVASACAQQGLATACIAPDVFERWENNFGVWIDEVEHLDLASAYGQRWENTDVFINENDHRSLDRGYVQFDQDKLKQLFIDRGTAKDPTALTMLKNSVQRVEHHQNHSVVVTDTDTYTCRLVIDASGFNGLALKRPKKKPDVFQVAYGIMAEVEKHPFDPNSMVLMDFRAKFLGKQHRPPTFLYVMPTSEKKLFMEETSVLDRPGVDIELLKDRLNQRLESLDIQVNKVEWEERCFIPMNPPLPDLTQRTLGFGAAAGFVHPGTGYSVALSLSIAPLLAEFLRRQLSTSNDLDDIAKSAWQQVIWPAKRRRMRYVYKFGMEFFNIINVHQLSAFLGLFFRSPEHFWRGYLSANVGMSDLMFGKSN